MTREVAEETAALLEVATESITGPVIWDPESKQAVFVHELAGGTDIVQAIQGLGHPPEVAQDVFDCHGAKPEGVVTAVWASTDMFREAQWRRLLHGWAAIWMETLIAVCCGRNVDGADQVTLDPRLQLQLSRC